MDRQAMQERFGIVGQSAGMRQALDRVRQVAGTEITVLVQGESGVGKELFAQAIHQLSGRRHKSLLIMNCGAIPEGLIESELFGAEKGAYTGAVERRTGYFEEADGGTIFLDEIGEIDAEQFQGVSSSGSVSSTADNADSTADKPHQSLWENADGAELRRIDEFGVCTLVQFKIKALVKHHNKAFA